MFLTYSMRDTIRTSKEDTEGSPRGRRWKAQPGLREKPRSAAGPTNKGKGRDSTGLTLKMGNHPRRRPST